MLAALIGLPQSGKSTVFTALTGPGHHHNPTEPVHAVVRVPDSRLEYLTELCRPKKTTEATIDFVDVPGASLDDPHGQEQWRHHLPTVRQADVLVVVVRDFQNSSVPAYRDRIDAQADFDAVWDELVFADLDAVTTRLDRIEKSLKKPAKTHDAEKREQAVLIRCREAVESGKPLLSVVTTEEDRRAVSSFAFVTLKPLVCVRNVSDDKIASSAPLAAAHATASLVLSAEIEAEIAALDAADRPAFMTELGITEPGRDRLARACYSAAGLISFLTMGPDEVRAWAVRHGSTAVEAAGKIHTDLARGFVRAETVSYYDLIAHTDLKGARAAGRVRKEGKTYVVQDGDILNILATA